MIVSCHHCSRICVTVVNVALLVVGISFFYSGGWRCLFFVAVGRVFLECYLVQVISSKGVS